MGALPRSKMYDGDAGYEYMFRRVEDRWGVRLVVTLSYETEEPFGTNVYLTCDVIHDVHREELGGVEKMRVPMLSTDIFSLDRQIMSLVSLWTAYVEGFLSQGPGINN